MQEIGCSGFVRHVIEASVFCSSLIKTFVGRKAFSSYCFETHPAYVSLMILNFYLISASCFL